MPTIKAIETCLGVADVKRSTAFYADVLNFDIGTLWPDDDPQFAILHRDGLRLQLRKRGSGATDAARESCTLWLDASGAVDLHSSIKSKVDIEWGPEVYFYHRREFAFRDPDGHMVIVSEVTSDPVTCEEQSSEAEGAQ